MSINERIGRSPTVVQRACCWLVACAGIAVVAGCAGYSIRAEERSSAGKWVPNGRSGYFVYEPKPYLLQTPRLDKDAKLTGYEYELVYLPDRTRRFRVTTFNFLAKSDISFSFKEGWMLTDIADKSDNTGFATEALKSLTALLPAMRTMDGGPEEAHPILYEIVFGADGGIESLRAIKP